MPISPEYLPSELHYIIPLAELHGTEARVAHYDPAIGRHVKYGERLSDEEIEPLKKLYVEIRTYGHGPQIYDWHDSHSGQETCPSETTWPIYGLMSLFAQLGEQGIAPFNDGEIGPQKQKQAEALDWSKLPPSLEYLARPAEIYGGLRFDDEIDSFLNERMTAAEQAELRVLSQRFGQDWEDIDRWLDQFPMTNHREARFVYFMGHLLGIGAGLGLW